FCDAQGLAVGVPHAVEPGLVIETSGLDDEDISLPSPDRVAVESGKVELHRKLTAVGEDLAMQRAGFVENDCRPWRLDKLDRLGQKTHERECWDAHANARRVVFGCPMAHDLLCGWPHRDFAGFEVHQDVEEVFVLGTYFHPGHVYFLCILDDLAVQAHH